MYMGEVVDRNDALNLIWGDDNYFQLEKYGCLYHKTEKDLQRRR